MNRSRSYLFVILIAVLTLSACNGQATPTLVISGLSQTLSSEATQTSLPELTPEPTRIVEPILTEPTLQVPLTEADVPRVTVQDAKAALDRGEAIIVDVRGGDAYRISHVAGAISIELGEFETNPAGIELDKNQWIITYCT